MTNADQRYNENTCFTHFTADIKNYALPERFTFPFYYEPHPLCVLAAEQLQQHIQAQSHWQHNFGLNENALLSQDDQPRETDTTNTPLDVIGKMFGVLLVKNHREEIAFLSAFSGKLANENHIPGFVPPVYDLLAKNSFFLTEQSKINQVSDTIASLMQSPELLALRKELHALTAHYQQQIRELKTELIDNRKERKIQRQALQDEPKKHIINSQLKALAAQSVADKWRLKNLTSEAQHAIGQVQQALDKLTDEIDHLKLQRKQQSAQLQNRIFSEYQFLNRDLNSKSLLDIFAETALKTPPAGAGECAAPKLLHHAFKHGLTPLAMAEFWWGAPPKSDIKKHRQYYPACTGKCQPILKHMLAGMALDDNPLTNNYAQDKVVDIIYQDADILIINKPTEFLSVPGKTLTDCVQRRIQQQFPQATGPLIVHRLDMSTSGLMVIALHSQANKSLQKQFIRRQVTKRYVALIEGLPQQNQGEITLPLRGDLFDRPKQIVCQQEGKPAQTLWQVLERFPESQRTKVLLTPHTGRTHQLRVHCAHATGLNMPIVGDDLYGRRAHRLHLHAQELTIKHPVSQEIMHFKVDAEF
jgi:tRNA pseudouridine32 synthase/23S rRNA pseudouridine746 synthase